MSTTPNDILSDAEAEAGETPTLAQRAREQAARLTGLARDNPRTAIAAGAAMVAGAAAAAAIPLVRAARRKPGNGAAAPKPETARKAPARKRAAPRKPAKKS